MKTIKIKKILVPVDFTEISQAAITKAITLSLLLKAKLSLIHVIDYNSFNFSIIPEIAVVSPPLKKVENAVSAKMEEMKAKIKKDFNIKADVCITTGDITSEIIDFSVKNKIDLIVMGTHGASGYKEIFIGSNAQRVVTLSEVPVLTMQKGKSKNGFKCILLPIDNSLHSREKVVLAMLMAKLFDAKIHILGLLDSKDKLELNKFKSKCDTVEKLVKSENLTFKTTIIEESNIAEAAMNYAGKNKCDLIVINTGHESESTGIFMGAFAQQIVNHSKIPVLSFKHSEGNYNIITPGFGIG